MTHEDQLQAWIDQHGVRAELIRYTVSCHTVEDAATATGAGVDAIVKNICMLSTAGELIVAILPGAARASTSRTGKALAAERPRLATPDEVLALSGYPAGGTPSFGFAARFIVDPLVMERDIVFTGGGSDRALVRITPDELVRANDALIVRVRK